VFLAGKFANVDFKLLSSGLFLQKMPLKLTNSQKKLQTNNCFYLKWLTYKG
jgi:hypothetical protein